MKLEPEDLYTIRKLALEADRVALEAQLKRIALKEKMLETEKAYGLLCTDSKLDLQTGEIGG